MIAAAASLAVAAQGLLGSMGDSAIGLILFLLSMCALGVVEASNANMDTVDWMLKEYYPDKKPQEIAWEDQVLLKMIPKNSEFTGRVLVTPLKYGRGTGRSADFAKSKSNRTASKGVDFYLPVRSDFGATTIELVAILASRNDMGSFLRTQTEEIDDMLENFGRSMAIDAYGIGSGVRGQFAVGTDVAGNTAVLRNPTDIVKFNEGEVIRLSDSSDGTGDVEVGELQIRAINTQTGELTFDDDISTAIPTATEDMFLSIDGDYGEKLIGLDGWLPIDGPTAAPFLGVNRTINPTRLGGLNMDLTGFPYAEAAIRFLRRLQRESNAKHDAIIVNDLVWVELEKEDSKKIIYNDPGPGIHNTYGIKAFSVIGKHGPVPIIPDPVCPIDRMYGLALDETWELSGLGDDGPALFDLDGKPFLRSTSVSGIDVEAYWHGGLRCKAPGKNGVAKITPPAYV